MSSQQNNKIAIVGIANQYPDADTPQDFWQNLIDKKDSRTTLSAEKLGANPQDYQGTQGQSDRFYCDKGGYIDNFAFDGQGYRVTEASFKGVDQSFLWALDTSRKALDDAGIALNADVLERTGVIMGALSFPTTRSNDLFLPMYHSVVEKALQTKLNSDQFSLLPTNEQAHDLNTVNGAAAHNASKLVADALGLGNVQLSLDAACASSVYSLKLACDYLNTGKADMMLAGAVSGADPFFINMGFSIFHAYPDHGVSVPFDSNSKGLFAGEGAGVLVLKRLADAERDGDNIYAVVSGIGLSNDGRGQFVLSPNSKGQVQAFERAYEASELTPDSIEVIECHATGTPLGDKVELTSMERFFTDKLNGSNAPLIGSAKSNLGHLLTAAGMPGIMKMIFAMKEGVLPPSINLDTPLSSPDGLFGSQTLPRNVQTWPSKSGNSERCAGVSVFGFGGCNAHLLLEAYSSTGAASPFSEQDTKERHPSAASPKASKLSIAGLASHFGSLPSINALSRAIDTDGNAFIELPKKRWKGLDQHPELLSQFGLNAVPAGAYIDQFELDFLRFKIPPNEDDRLISQQLLLMKVADEAIRDAKLVAGQKVAVLVAMETELEMHQFRGRVNLHSQLAESFANMGVELSQDEYQALETIAMDSVMDAAKLNQYTSFIGNIMASRISSLWDFNGPAFTISAAEQSVTRCIDVAQNLMSQESLDAVVIAAVDLSGSAEHVILKNSVTPVAMQPQDAGWNVGEGAGAIVLVDEQYAATRQITEDGKVTSYGQIGELAFGNSTRSQAVTDSLLTQSATHSTQIAVVELNHAPEKGVPLGHTDILVNHVAKQTQASKRLGHCSAASGMASLLHGLLNLNGIADPVAGHPSKQAIIANVSEGQCSQLLVSQSKIESQALTLRLQREIASDAKRQLIKSVSLGGRDIYQHITQAPLSTLPHIQQKMVGKTGRRKVSVPTLSPATVAMPVETKPVKTKLVKTKPAIEIQSSNSTTLTGVALHASRQSPFIGNHSTMTDVLSAKNSAPTSQLSATQDSAFQQNQQLTQQVHQAFLHNRAQGLQIADALLKAQLNEITQGLEGGATTIASNNSASNNIAPNSPLGTNVATPVTQTVVATQPVVEPVNVYAAPARPVRKPCIWDYDDLVEYAEGDIAKVFGPDYAIIDSYKRRVRLPTTDYLLVSRVTKLDATMLEYKPSTMTTEYDIPVDAPYLVDGQIPWAVAVESGQCDLMLISYLGIDFENKGERVYRLLDCTLTFLGDLPRGGDTLRYDISINNYARNGDTLLFFFSYECFIGDKMILKMDNGCAGFFTDEELADGKGVIHTESEIKARQLATKQRFEPILHCPKSQFDHSALRHLLTANIAECFGPTHQSNTHQPSLCFSSEKFMMIEQVSRVEPQGGTWGLGLIEGHKQLEKEHWYFPCHFKDDNVMAGSLMAEGCGQLLQFYMMHLGMHTLVENGRFQPLANAPQQVRCRGQVLPQSAQLTYRMEVTEIGVSPRPYAKANIDILLNGKVIVDFQNLGVMIKEEAECTRYPQLIGSSESVNVEALTAATVAPTETKASNQASANAPLMAQIPDLETATNKGVIPLQHVEAPITPDYLNRTPDTVPFTPYHMFEFATGDIEKCFGPDFSIYRGMIPPRTPCGDLQLTTRVVEINGKRGDFKKPSSCIAEYEVPANAWYFDENSHETLMPYSVLMEISLQPNGFISGYMGTTLGFPGEELFFRNLDGSGKMLRNVDLRGKTITNDSRLLSTVMMGTNIVQSFSFELSTDGVPFYEGKAVFGYFKGAALKDQLGLDNGKVTQPWHVDNNRTPDVSINLLDKSSRYFNAPVLANGATQPHYQLAGGRLNFIDNVQITSDGGKSGLGYLYAERTIDPSDWFFQFHFHQDPVMPGSLGVEAIIELMQTYALNKDLGAGFRSPKFGQIQSEVKWKYRGQINPLNKQMSLDVHITAIKDEDGKKIIVGDANLSKDGLRIYEVKDIAICIEEA
ncbi:beta-hydroxyacyl-ACP dehydratase [Vibrio sp. 10N.286.49.C2]|uniref:beta-ketoacyl synthase N-terminal-like domain-containing protein n=1 Tax=unclassified Vibrio TaxID=2614977 RepID=UPI000C849259|nr:MULTISPECIES: beta-ketoacyl synthase N-terminal-like domain-containing protein [unclassified Vibrio]PMH38126.1 beta-hydroxyacyl-ACP dehydratase [Vibrio sp. 10N.286.49.C2]PMH53668.1 beta-hydroxyacyl-ACP dehydratase [Vibrio sp. 10N.286.49.B1]PMH82597.1 beta-hydroxyacyl-ACP dehydratase [Vibrio sp. 10N.286.48.B7]